MEDTTSDARGRIPTVTMVPIYVSARTDSLDDIIPYVFWIYLKKKVGQQPLKLQLKNMDYYSEPCSSCS